MTSLNQQLAEKYGLAKGEDYWFHEQSRSMIIKHDAVVRIAHEEGINLDIVKVLDDSEDHKALLVKGWKNIELVGYDPKDPPTATDLEGPSAVMVGECAVGTKGITAQYPWCMAQKRGEDRCVLRIVAPGGGVYSDVEADDFRKGGSTPESAAASEPRRQPSQPAPGGVPGGGGGGSQGFNNPPPVEAVPDGLAVPQEMLGMVFPEHAALGFGKHKNRTWGDLARDPDPQNSGYFEWMVKSVLAKKGTNFQQWSDREVSALYYSQLGNQATPPGEGSAPSLPDDVPF